MPLNGGGWVGGTALATEWRKVGGLDCACHNRIPTFVPAPSAVCAERMAAWVGLHVPQNNFLSRSRPQFSPLPMYYTYASAVGRRRLHFCTSTRQCTTPRGGRTVTRKRPVAMRPPTLYANERCLALSPGYVRPPGVRAPLAQPAVLKIEPPRTSAAAVPATSLHRDRSFPRRGSLAVRY